MRTSTNMVYLSTLIIVLNVIYVKCHDNTTLSDPVDAFASLMTLTLQQCGRIDWCYIKLTDPTFVTSIGNGCCKRCTCSDDCLVTISCCPDFSLRDILTGMSFLNISDVVSTLRVGPFTDVDHFHHIPTRQSNDTPILTCSYSRLKPLDTLRPISSMYFMITSCSNESIEYGLRSKCESPYNLDTSLQPTDIVPVQSLTTGIVYRNKHCYSCGAEKHDHYVYWDMVVAYNVRPNTFLNHVDSSLNNMLTRILSNVKVDIFFEPNARLFQMQPPDACDIVNVETCSPKNKSYEDKEMEAACQSYHLPVYAKVNGTIKSYKNIACVNCYNALRECSFFYRWDQSAKAISPPSPFLGTLALTPNEYQYIESEFDGKQLGNRLAKLFSANCELGFVYDKELDLCRKIYCPCGMMLLNSICVFIFGEINAAFEVVVTVSVEGKLPNTSDAIIWSNLQHFINASAIFEPTDIILFKSKKMDGEYASVITVTRRNSSVKYSDVTSEALNMFVGNSFVSTLTNERFKIKVTLTDTMVLNRMTMFDRKSGETYNLVYPSKDTIKNVIKVPNIVLISECNFCYRVEVMQSELRESRALNLYVKRTKTIFSDSEIHALDLNYSRIILCVDKVFRPQEKIDSGSIDDVSRKGQDQEESGDIDVPTTLIDVDYIIALPAAVAIVVITVCVLRCVCRRAVAENIPPSENEIQLSTLSSP